MVLSKILNLISHIIVSNIYYIFKSNCFNKWKVFLRKSIGPINSRRNAVKQFGRNHIVAIPNCSLRQHLLVIENNFSLLFKK